MIFIIKIYIEIKYILNISNKTNRYLFLYIKLVKLLFFFEIISKIHNHLRIKLKIIKLHFENFELFSKNLKIIIYLLFHKLIYKYINFFINFNL